MRAEALRAMEKVASHINEMQKIYEDYGAVFDQLVAEQTGQEKEVRSRGADVYAHPPDLDTHANKHTPRIAAGGLKAVTN